MMTMTLLRRFAYTALAYPEGVVRRFNPSPFGAPLKVPNIFELGVGKRTLLLFTKSYISARKCQKLYTLISHVTSACGG